MSCCDLRRSGRDLALVIALVALAGVPSLFTRDLWNPDEPRYMEVAREMVVLGDYVMPHLNGQVYSEKPPCSSGSPDGSGRSDLGATRDAW